MHCTCHVHFFFCHFCAVFYVIGLLLLHHPLLFVPTKLLLFLVKLLVMICSFYINGSKNTNCVCFIYFVFAKCTGILVTIKCTQILKAWVSDCAALCTPVSI